MRPGKADSRCHFRVVHSCYIYESSLFCLSKALAAPLHLTSSPHSPLIRHPPWATHHPTPDQFTYDNVFIYYQPGDGKVSPHHTKCLLLKLIETARQASTGAQPRFANLTNLANFTNLTTFYLHSPPRSKIKKKEPINMVKQAMKQLDAIIPTLE